MTHTDAIRLALLQVTRCGGRAWRQEVGLFTDERGIKRRLGLKGMADIGGIAPDGRCLQIEIKTGQAQPTHWQRAWREMILARGGLYILARYSETSDGDRAIRETMMQEGG